MDGLLQLLGYFSYGFLVLIAAGWMLGVRTQLGAGLEVIVGSLLFVLAAFALPVFHMSLLHSLWIIPAVIAISVVVIPRILARRIPVLWTLLMFAGSLYANLVRVGISSSRIAEAQHRDAVETVKQWAVKKRNYESRVSQ